MKDISEQDLDGNLRLVRRRAADHTTRARVGNQTIGEGAFTVIAGPCTVESREQVIDIAEHVKRSGAHVLRGGAYKPLTFPYRSERVFELGVEGLRYLREAADRVSLPAVSEVTDTTLVAEAAPYLDMIQIGARNMQNFRLLEAVARTGKPVLLKRHFGASLRDWLGAAEYLLFHGDGRTDVILCERGIVAPHTHMPTSRFIVDLQVVLAAKEITHLPVIVDPSHSTFRRSFVAPVGRAALAIGADGIILDVHPTPEKAAVDPLQALSYDAFDTLMGELRGIAGVLHKTVDHAISA
jgi:3-deoxy-7-phosphoheptulonate synthase